MKILIADDSAVSRKILTKKLVEWGHDVVAVQDGEAVTQILQTRYTPQVAILDWVMPRMEGPEVCSWIRKCHREPYIYTILLTSKSSKDDFAAGMDSGADDYLTKPFSPVELKARLGSARRMLDLLSELRSTREALQVQATHDSLTGLLNRGEISRLLEVEISRSRREKSDLGVLLADLDHFKSINDSYGHLVGDKVLCEISKRLQDSSRSYDLTGRYGGEEFLVVLPGCTGDSALHVAQRHLEAVAGEPIAGFGQEIHVTLSIGVTATNGSLPSDAISLLRTADGALYQAKRGGRNRVVFSAFSIDSYRGSTPSVSEDEFPGGESVNVIRSA